jgi:predicted Zn-dependent protease
VRRSFVPHAPYLRVHLAKIIADAVPRWVAAERREEARALLSEAWEGVREAQIAYPLDVQLAVVAASVAGQQALLTSETEHLRLAGETLAEAHQFAPGRQDLKFALARTLLLSGQPQEALEWAEDAYRGEPDAPDSVRQLAEILARVGQTDDARQLVAEALARGVVFRGESARFALELLDE